MTFATRALALLILTMVLILPITATFDATTQDRQNISAPPGTAGHWLGTDDLGRDLWARYAHGARWSVGAGLLATTATLLLGWLIGAAAGWFSGWTDRVLMACANVVLAVPWLFLLLALRSALPLDWPSRTIAAATLAAVVLVSWPKPAQVIRAVVLSTVAAGYVRAAEGFGLTPTRILIRHVLPSTAGTLLAQALTLLPRFVLADITLSLFGLGISDPDPSWGALLLPLRRAWLLQAEWWLLLPGLLMAPFFLLAAWAGRKLEREL